MSFELRLDYFILLYFIIFYFIFLKFYLLCFTQHSRGVKFNLRNCHLRILLDPSLPPDEHLTRCLPCLTTLLMTVAASCIAVTSPLPFPSFLLLFLPTLLATTLLCFMGVLPALPQSVAPRRRFAVDPSSSSNPVRPEPLLRDEKAATFAHLTLNFFHCFGLATAAAAGQSLTDWGGLSVSIPSPSRAPSHTEPPSSLFLVPVTRRNSAVSLARTTVSHVHPPLLSVTAEDQHPLPPPAVRLLASTVRPPAVGVVARRQ